MLPLNEKSFLKRFYIYQKERFPFLTHGILIASFTFSAISYSRICRTADGFIPLDTFLIAIFLTITFFFLLRIFDEFKDAEDDAKYRKSLPVPRGLISFSELKSVGIITVILQILLLIFIYPQLIWLYAIAMGYMLLMAKEFFVTDWLKKRQLIYVFSHMMIIPLVDVFASGFDWLLEKQEAPSGLLFFFAVSFMNGVVLEFGRKIRTPEKEAFGVITYSYLYGPKKATKLWLLLLTSTLTLSMLSSAFAGHPSWVYLGLSCVYLLCCLPAFFFLKRQTEKSSKWIEHASGLWAIAIYLLLGGAPMLSKLMGF